MGWPLLFEALIVFGVFFFGRYQVRMEKRRRTMTVVVRAGFENNWDVELTRRVMKALNRMDRSNYGSADWQDVGKNALKFTGGT